MTSKETAQAVIESMIEALDASFPQLGQAGWEEAEESPIRSRDSTAVIVRSPWFLGNEDGTTAHDFAQGTTAAFASLGAEMVQEPKDVTGGWLLASGRRGDAEITVLSKGSTEITVRVPSD